MGTIRSLALFAAGWLLGSWLMPLPTPWLAGERAGAEAQDDATPSAERLDTRPDAGGVATPGPWTPDPPPVRREPSASTNSAPEARPVTPIGLATIEAWAEAGQVQRAVQALSTYLAENPFEARAWWLQARLDVAQGKRRAALATLLELLSAFPEPQIPAAARPLALDLAHDRVRGLHDDGNERALLELLQRLTQLWPEEPEFHYRLARLLLARGQHAEAAAHLAHARQDPRWAERARALTAELDQRRDRLADNAREIPLRRTGEHLIVDVRVAGGATIALLLDTGASLTVLTPFAAAQSGLAPLPGQGLHLETAGGPVTASLLPPSSIALGDLTVHGVRAGQLDLRLPPGVDGLLGMDVLGEFTFGIDRERRLLRLAPRPAHGGA